MKNPFNPPSKRWQNTHFFVFLYLNLISLSPSKTTCRMVLRQFQPIALRHPTVSLDSASDWLFLISVGKHEIWPVRSSPASASAGLWQVFCLYIIHSYFCSLCWMLVVNGTVKGLNSVTLKHLSRLKSRWLSHTWVWNSFSAFDPSPEGAVTSSGATLGNQ